MGELKSLTNQPIFLLTIRSNKQICGNNNGTSIIEVIIGMVILAMLVAGLNAGVLSLVNTNKSSKEIAAASNFGYEKLEEIRRNSYNDISSKSDSKEGIYVYDVLVTSDGNNTQKSVKIDILWPSTSTDPKHQISLSTIIARP